MSPADLEALARELDGVRRAAESALGMGVAQSHALAAVAANPRVEPHLDEAEELLVGQAAVQWLARS